MRILFVHQNFPGQYKHLAPALAARGHEVHALAITRQATPPGVSVQRYGIARGNSKGIHPWAVEFETKVLRGDACARAALKLKGTGFEPDLICAHPGWGESLFLREVWPDARQLHFVEFFYSAQGRDVGFDPEFGEPDFENRCRVRAKNANNLINLDMMDQGVSPTHWQMSTVPAAYHPKLSVIHDGIDTGHVRPDASAHFEWKMEDGTARRVSSADEVLTFVNRNLEPSRGYHIFMRSLPLILQRRPSLQVLVVGGDGVSYGAKPEEGGYKDRYLAEVAADIDRSRVHFLGKLPYSRYLKLLQVSGAHVYLTYPFVLSWSMLEAMSAACLVIGSRTSPVEEVIEDGKNGLLVDFFSPSEIADSVCRVFDHPDRMAQLRTKARATVVANYDLHSCCLPAQIALVESFAGAPPG
jgi:glycosyltransferase involved in cell wall biosynthesis